MRIITGMYRGRVLRTVKDLSVRPATGRVRQTIFDVLSHRAGLDGSRVLDLFAGSGSLGIECLSRGAAHATFVESDPNALRFLEENITMLGCELKTEVVPMDAMAYLRGTRDPFDVIFADPPYKFPETPTLADAVFRCALLAAEGYLLIEHTTELRFPDSETYRVATEKRFGRTVVTFLRHSSNGPRTRQS